MSTKEIDWARVEKLIYDSVRGRADPSQVTKVCSEALSADPERYRELHARIREEAQNELKRF